jgi:hypothetical protein
VKALVPDFDFAIVEECFHYRECGKAVPFIDAGKAVLEVEFKLTRALAPRIVLVRPHGR